MVNILFINNGIWCAIHSVSATNIPILNVIGRILETLTE